MRQSWKLHTLSLILLARVLPLERNRCLRVGQKHWNEYERIIYIKKLIESDKYAEQKRKEKKQRKRRGIESSSAKGCAKKEVMGIFLFLTERKEGEGERRKMRTTFYRIGTKWWLHQNYSLYHSHWLRSRGSERVRGMRRVSLLWANS